jgi:hypothetical protein
MKWNTVQKTLLVSLLFLLGALTDPFMYWMPSVPQMLALTLSCAGLVVWMGLLAREGVEDERDAEHRMFAGRVAYISGVLILTIALVTQGLSHHSIDPWIPGALSVMIIAKLGARWYSDKFW